MASLDFELEKKLFREFYAQHQCDLENIKNHYINTIETLINQSDLDEVTKIEGRVKDQDECIKKFQRKYQGKLETEGHPYAIKDYLSDLIGIRIVCLYEDQVAQVSETLKEHFNIIDVTDKIAAMEGTEDLFGYKGLHMDLAPNTAVVNHDGIVNFPFEVQIRSLIQDTWSVLDHKIKYKKSIPNNLKRRINVLSALFELADREFKEIRNATSELMEEATAAPLSDSPAVDGETEDAQSINGRAINAFNFLRVAGHFFRDFEFQDYKVDNFVQDILSLDHRFKRSDLHQSLVNNLKTVKEYRNLFMAANPDNTFSPYTIIRHCLYLHDRKTFERILSQGPRERFNRWLRARENNGVTDKEGK
ncbi:GTP pyrophosphokinase [Pelovirga terrestris]|uniref:(P)ppGpp synthetase n=1 Tax=Pelovirga terrestris TaxID=2771352 RepID=A0A8J6QY50_9BACT|nr:(p)ppGpp synthetase [Pelovirga terrestris]MBD1400617.1 (p)ppGpp synthetase [Pelovirga terrestris]